MGQTMGTPDKNATNDVMGGRVVATGTPGAQTVRDPNRGLDDSQIRNRRLLGMGARTLGNTFNPNGTQPITSPMNNPNNPIEGGGVPLTFANNQPALTPPPTAQSVFQDYMPLSKGARNPFFG